MRSPRFKIQTLIMFVLVAGSVLGLLTRFVATAPHPGFAAIALLLWLVAPLPFVLLSVLGGMTLAAIAPRRLRAAWPWRKPRFTILAMMAVVAFVAVFAAIAVSWHDHYEARMPYSSWSDQRKAEWFALREAMELELAAKAERGQGFPMQPVISEAQGKRLAARIRESAAYSAAMARKYRRAASGLGPSDEPNRTQAQAQDADRAAP